MAAQRGHLEVVKFLTVEKYCDPMSQNDDGNTALHYAVHGGHLEIIKFFTEKLYCPPDIAGQHNLTPFQMARDLHHSDIAEYLQKHSVIPYIKTAILIIMTSVHDLSSWGEPERAAH